MIDKISPDDIARARRKINRRFAALIIKAMAESDMSLKDIAVRAGIFYPTLKDKLDKMINGVSILNSFDFISDVLLAMDAELGWAIVPIKKIDGTDKS